MDLQYAAGKAAKKLKKKYGATAIVVLNDGNQSYFGSKGKLRNSDLLVIAGGFIDLCDWK